MKYIVMDAPRSGDGDYFPQEFEDRESAIDAAKRDWDSREKQDKKGRKLYVIESANPDEEAEDHYDGSYIWDCDEYDKKEHPWYAVMEGEGDTDWGYGSYDLEEAKEMATNYGENAYIAVIEEGTDPICIGEIHQEEF